MPAPTDPQDLNRYSYCLNNPLRYTDPTGFGIFDFIGGIFRGIGHAFEDVGNFVSNLFDNKTVKLLIQVVAGVINPYLVPLVSAAMTAAAGGDFVDVLKVAALAELNILAWGEVGNLTGGLSGGRWLGSFEGFMGNATSTAVHGIVGGGLSCLEGGSFKDGFLGAAVGEACAGAINNLHSFANDQMNILERSAAAGVIGGTAAVVSGGNFITGASTAAFERLYNEEKHAISMKLQRIAEGPKSTYGELTVTKGDKTLTVDTLELGGPSSGEEGSMKRVPAGEYDVSPYDSKNFHGKYKLTSNDPDNYRTDILIHTGNTVGNTHGCILVGEHGQYGNGDYYILPKTSRPAFTALHNFVGNNRAKLTIIDP